MDFFNPTWAYGTASEISKFLGFAHIVVLVAALYFVRFMGRTSKILLIGILVSVVAFLLLMTSVAEPVWKTVTLLQKFQFPWRFLHVTTFIVPIIAALVVATLGKHQRTLVVVLLSVIAIVSSVSMWHAKEYTSMPDSNFTGVYNGTTDTGESAPIWSIRFMERSAKAPIEVISGKDVSITIGTQTSTHHSYRITSLSSVTLVENTLYFPNWEVFVDKTRVPVEFQNPQFRGLLTFEVSEGVHDVEIIFSDTKLRTFANWISIVGIIIFLGFLVTMGLWQKENNYIRRYCDI